MNKIELTKALKTIKKCNGDCLHCEKLHYYFADTPHAIYMAYGCDLLPQDEYAYLADKFNGNDSLYEHVVAIVEGEAKEKGVKTA